MHVSRWPYYVRQYRRENLKLPRWRALKMPRATLNGVLLLPKRCVNNNGFGFLSRWLESLMSQLPLIAWFSVVWYWVCVPSWTVWIHEEMLRVWRCRIFWSINWKMRLNWMSYWMNFGVREDYLMHELNSTGTGACYLLNLPIATVL